MDTEEEQDRSLDKHLGRHFNLKKRHHGAIRIAKYLTTYRIGE